jgi:hypothetical protein
MGDEPTSRGEWNEMPLVLTFIANVVAQIAGLLTGLI